MFEDLRGAKEEHRGKGRDAFGNYIYYDDDDDDAGYARYEIAGEQQIGQKKNQTEETQGI